jgi:hypothetical protein
VGTHGLHKATEQRKSFKTIQNLWMFKLNKDRGEKKVLKDYDFVKNSLRKKKKKKMEMSSYFRARGILYSLELIKSRIREVT